MKKILLLILDGLSDLSIKELGDKTPLELAYTPNLDRMAEEGICGVCIPNQFSFERTPTSEGAHIGLFGYKDYFLGRGPYEAAGIGMQMEKGDVALRANFATVDEDLNIIDRRAGRVDNTSELINALKDIEIEGVKFLIEKTTGHRAVLILRGKNLSKEIEDGDPHQNTKARTIKAKTKDAEFTAKVLNEYLKITHNILKSHPFNKDRKLPANYLLTRGAGQFEETPSFQKKYNKKAACVAGGGLYKGVAKILGMDLIEAQGATGKSNTNIKNKILKTKEALNDYDFVFLHIKGTDTFGHDGDFKGKKEFIEKIDKELSLLLDLKDTLIVVTADHSTPCKAKDHSSDPVPILVFGNGKDSVKTFSEKSCRKGKLETFSANDLMNIVLQFCKD